jgi:hypothetical protein
MIRKIKNIINKEPLNVDSNNDNTTSDTTITNIKIINNQNTTSPINYLKKSNLIYQTNISNPILFKILKFEI